MEPADPPRETDLDRLHEQIAELEERQSQVAGLWRPPGHFYSPITTREEIERDAARIFNRSVPDLPGVDLNADTQIALFDRVMALEPELDRDFPREKTEGYRYYSENNYFPYCDALFLAGVLRLFRPKRVIEVGSGFSSAVMLDIDARYLDGSVFFRFVEPHPDRLRSLLRDGDRERHRIHACRVQDVPLEVYDGFEADDVLFIDSSHVAKTGSDVNHLFFEVIPRLRKGVLVHVHDVTWPFEYGEDDAYEGRSWNEAYVTRAFLQYNRCFEILVYPSAFGHLGSGVGRELPERCLEPMGPSLWLRRVAE